MTATSDAEDAVGQDMAPLRDRTWVVAVAAAMWGLDGLLRKPLATTLDAATVVLWEHLIAVIAICWLIPPAIAVYRRCGLRDQVAIAVIGVGASAVATAMFTEAFALSVKTYDFITPLVLQKLQPLIAVGLAVAVLGERLRARFAFYAVPALVGAWLLAFADPFDVKVAAVKVALLSLGAAALWAAGTVLGRMVSASVQPRELTVLRYVWGLPAAFLVALRTHAGLAPGWHNLFGLALLALIPGLAALSLYYYGLRATAASRATFAELAFPGTAAVVGVLFLNSHLSWSQWLGFLVVVGSITALGWNERTRRSAVADPLAADVPVS
jgi:DME family drug/metabolite transporter